MCFQRGRPPRSALPDPVPRSPFPRSRRPSLSPRPPAPGYPPYGPLEAMWGNENTEHSLLHRLTPVPSLAATCLQLLRADGHPRTAAATAPRPQRRCALLHRLRRRQRRWQRRRQHLGQPPDGLHGPAARRHGGMEHRMDARKVSCFVDHWQRTSSTDLTSARNSSERSSRECLPLQATFRAAGIGCLLV